MKSVTCSMYSRVFFEYSNSIELSLAPGERGPASESTSRHARRPCRTIQHRGRGPGGAHATRRRGARGAPLRGRGARAIPGAAGRRPRRRRPVGQFQGGQSNPTYLLSAGGREYVLRRKPPGRLLPSAHAVDREYRVLTALAATDVPVPRTYVYCDDPTVIGTPFYVMDCVRGRIFADPQLPGVSPAERAALYDAMNAVLARLHGLDWQ